VAGDVLRDPEAGLIEARLQIGSRGRADGAGVELREPHSLAGEPVDPRRLVKPIAVADEIGPAEVVGENDDDIGRHGCRSARLGSRPAGDAAAHRDGDQQSANEPSVSRQSVIRRSVHERDLLAGGTSRCRLGRHPISHRGTPRRG
jgi:hypothetical protein